MTTLRRTVLGGLVGLVVGGACVVLYDAGWTERWELPIRDLWFRLRPDQPDSGLVVVVGITQDCIDQLHPPPWPRRWFGEAVEELNRLGASVIAFDIFFPVSSPFNEEDRDDDRQLADVMQRSGNVILSIFDEYRGSQANVIRLRENIPVLTQAAAGTGHINVIQDSDGVVRRVPVQVGSLARKHLQLGLLAGAQHLGIRDLEPRWGRGTVRLGHLTLPIDKQGNLLVNWRSEAVWHSPGRLLSFADVYSGRVTAEQVRGKIVLIGQTCPGLPNADMIATPLGPRFGLLAQADVAESVVTGRYVRNVSKTIYVALLLIAMVIGGVVLFSLRLLPLILSAMAGITATAALSFLVFSHWGILVDIVPPVLAIVSTAGTSLGFALVRTKAEVRRQAEALEMLHSAAQETTGLILSACSAGSKTADSMEATGPYAASLQIPRLTPPTVLRSLTASLGAHYGFMRLTENDGRARWLSTATEDDPTASEARQCAEVLVPLVSEDNPGIVIPSLKKDAALRQFVPYVESALAVRLGLGDETLGTVVLCGKRPTPVSPTRHFEIADLRVACAMAPQGALLLDHVRLHRNLHSILMRVVRTLTAAVHAKDAYTRGHSERVAFYATFLARQMGLPDETLEIVKLGALLHDVGKIGMDEVLLRGSQQLVEEEWERIKQHPATGSDIFADMKELSFLLPALRHHHERYDGTGYPDGLKGAEIPLLARIMAIADAFDAMTFERSYRPEPLSFEEACQELIRGAGTQFDAELARLFVQRATADIIHEARRGIIQAAERPSVPAATI